MARLLFIIILFSLKSEFSAQESPVIFEHSIFSKFSAGMFHTTSVDKAGRIFDDNGYRPIIPLPASSFHVIFDNGIFLGVQYSFFSIRSKREQFAKGVELNPQNQIAEASMPYTEKSQITNYKVRTHLLKFGIGHIHQKSKVKQQNISANLLFGYNRMGELKVGIATIGTNEIIRRVYRLNASPIFGLSLDFSSKKLGTSFTTAKKTHQTADSFGIEPMIWTTLNRVQYDEYNFFTHQEKTVNYRVFNFHYGFQIHYTFSNRIMGRKRVI